MMTQRKPVEDFLDATGHDERGELSRFLMCSPPDWRGYSKLGPPVPGLHFKYAEERARWLGLLGAQEAAQTVRPTPEALSRFEEWHEEHERLQRPGGPRREPAGWVSKMRGLVWRLAGIIHMAETVTPSGAVAPEIPLEVLERAIAIAEWGLEQARAIYRVTQANVVSRQLDRLRDVLGEKPGMRRSELWGRLKGSQGITRAAHLTGLLDELETCGELRREETSPGPRGGRPGQRLWLVPVGSGEETGT